MKMIQLAVLGLSGLVLVACQSDAGVASAALETGEYTCDIQSSQGTVERVLDVIVTRATDEAVELHLKRYEAETKLALSKAKTGVFVNIGEEAALIAETNGKFKMYQTVAADNADGYELVSVDAAICQKSE